MARVQVLAAFGLVTLTCLAGVCADHNAVAQTAREHTAAAEFREADVTLNGLRFHYLEWGNQNAPALLLIPGTGGGGGCAEYWIPLASAMRDRYHTYAMEQRGQCDSEAAKEYTWQRVVEDIDGFVDKFHLAPVTLVGHSSGAVWGYLYAAQHPDKVSRLVAVDGGGAFNWPKTRAEAQQRAPLASRHVTFSSPEEAVTYAKTRWRTDPSVDAVVREWVLHGIRKLDDGRWGWRQDPAAVAATDQYIFLPTEDELNGALPRIKCPTLIVRGSEGAVSRELANHVAHAIANGSWAEVANSGHVVPLANPSGFLALVRQFLANSFNPEIEQTRLLKEPVLKVVLLGTGGPTPRIERFGPSTLVEAGGRHFLFDCGRGAAQRLLQLGILREVTALFLTHLHSDHVVGIPDVWLSGWFTGRNTPLQVWGPAGTQEMIAHLQKAYAFDIQTRTGSPEHLPSSGVAVTAKDIAEGSVYRDDAVTITAFNVEHGPVKPALGYRLDYAGHSVVISGDTRPSDNLVRFAKGTDVLIHNAVVVPEAEQNSPRARSAMQLLATAQEAGSVFGRVKPRLAVYSHYNTADDLVAQTRQTYSGPLEVGEDLMAVEIGERIQVRRQSDKSAQIREAEQEVQQAEDELNEAVRHNDAAALARISMDDLFITGPKGRTTDKARIVESYRSGQRVYESLIIEGQKIRVYNDAAVVTFHRKQTVRVQGGYPDHVWTSRVWAKQQGRWRLAVLHVSPIEAIRIDPLPPTPSPAIDEEISPRDDAAQELRQAEAARRDAILRGDAKMIAPLLADEYSVITASGSFYNKASELSLYTRSERNTQAWDADDVIVRVYGNFAVVTQRATVKDTLKGQRRDVQFRLTHVWVKRQKRWQIVHRHGTPILPTPEGDSSNSEKDARSESADKAGNAEQEVRQVERELTEALLRDEFAAVGRIYADDFTLTNANGLVRDRARRMAMLKSGAVKNLSINQEDVDVRVYGDTAVVTGRAAFRVRSDAEEHGETQRFMHVLVKREGRWQMVAQQMTRITEAPIMPKANGRSSASAANTEQGTGTRETSVEQEIRRLENERAGAFERGDIELVKRMSSDDYIATSVTGQVKNKAQVLEEMTSGGRRLKFIHDDIRVRVYGNTAVITGRSTRKGRENSNEVDDQVRFTGVYAKQNGRWLKVAQQATRIGH